MLDMAAITLIGLGLFLFASAVIGILRFPDFYTRLHPAGKMDTLGTLLVLAGVAIYNVQEFDLEHILVSLKILLIAGFSFIAGPTATHAIVDAGLRAGLRPWLKGQARR